MIDIFMCGALCVFTAIFKAGAVTPPKQRLSLSPQGAVLWPQPPPAGTALSRALGSCLGTSVTVAGMSDPPFSFLLL